LSWGIIAQGEPLKNAYKIGALGRPGCTSFSSTPWIREVIKPKNAESGRNNLAVSGGNVGGNVQQRYKGRKQEGMCFGMAWWKKGGFRVRIQYEHTRPLRGSLGRLVGASLGKGFFEKIIAALTY
jgi:hypothetical protein